MKNVRVCLEKVKLILEVSGEMLVEKTKTWLQIFYSSVKKKKNLFSPSLASETNQLSYYPNHDTSELNLFLLGPGSSERAWWLSCGHSMVNSYGIVPHLQFLKSFEGRCVLG